jgi:ribosomal protein S27E
MDIKGKNFHSLYGGMQSDYLQLYCEDCDTQIRSIKWYCADPAIGCQLQTKCPKCGEESIFKFPLFGVEPKSST